MNASLAVQLYSVREQLVDDRKGTLAALASFGYENVECFDPFTDPEGQRAALDAAGLTAVSTHGHVLGDDAEEIFRGARVLGVDTVVVPFQPPERFADEEGVRAVAAELNAAAARAAELGFRLAYHNHEFELSQHVGGRTAFEALVDLLDPEVLLEVDAYWAAVGGQDVPALLGRLGGRVTHLHVKDGPISREEPMTAVGQGRMPIAAILAAASSARWHIVELDHCATDMLTAVKDSLDWLREQR